MDPNASADLSFLRKLVFGVSQNVLDPAQDYLFESRLTGLLRNYGMTRIGELVLHLRARNDPVLERAVAEAMTINETSFFRDRRPFELLRTEVLPRLIESRRSSRSLRLWSAACSTGQEAYSLAMLILDRAATLVGWNIRIEGTDISSEVIARAQAGMYQRAEIERGLTGCHLIRYFDREGEAWTVNPELRSLCNFRQANLCGPRMPFSRAVDRFDLILLRNVMLYFSQEHRRALLAGIHRLLPPDGVLVLGASEQPADPSLWTPVLSGGACYFKPRQPS